MIYINVRNQYIEKGRNYVQNELKDVWDTRTSYMNTYNIGTIIDFLWLLDNIDDMKIIRNTIRCQKNYLNDYIIANIIFFTKHADTFIEALKLEKTEEDKYDLESKLVLENINKKELLGFNKYNSLKDNSVNLYQLVLDIFGSKKAIEVVLDKDNYIKGTLDNNLIIGKIIDVEHVFLYVISDKYIYKFYGTLDNNILNLMKMNNKHYTSFNFNKINMDTNILSNINCKVNSLINKLPYDLVGQLVEDSEAVLNLIGNKIVK